jgi:glycosyltransferase involved in cell wall biosynthesis
MNDEYVVLGGLLWRMMGKKTGLWYAHGHVPLSLRIAEKLAHVIFTSTKSGCRIGSKKIKVVGQGIDVNRVKNNESRGLEIKNYEFKVITVGRISPSKDYETLIRAAEVLLKENVKVKVDIVGGPGTPEQGEYFENLKKMVKERSLEEVIIFRGSMPNREIVPALNEADLFVNMGLTGSLDKAILEAMAAGLPILTCNEALEDVLGNYSGRLMFKKKDYMELSEKIKDIMGLKTGARMKMGMDLREIVVKNHSLSGLIKKIVQILE